MQYFAQFSTVNESLHVNRLIDREPIVGRNIMTDNEQSIIPVNGLASTLTGIVSSQLPPAILILLHHYST